MFVEPERAFPSDSDSPQTKVEVRVITATVRNLTEMIAAGQFLEDLFYRPCELLEQRFIPPFDSRRSRRRRSRKSWGVMSRARNIG